MRPSISSSNLKKPSNGAQSSSSFPVSPFPPASPGDSKSPSFGVSRGPKSLSSNFSNNASNTVTLPTNFSNVSSAFSAIKPASSPSGEFQYVHMPRPAAVSQAQPELSILGPGAGHAHYGERSSYTPFGSPNDDIETVDSDHDSPSTSRASTPALTFPSPELDRLQKLIPRCVERNCLVLEVLLKECENSTSISRPLHRALEKEMAELHDRINLEQVFIPEVTNALQQLSAYFSKQAWREAIAATKSILGHVLKLDVDMLFNYAESSQKAGESLSRRHVILLIGSTGAGKSTFTHFMSGSPMKLDENKQPVPATYSQALSNVKVALSTESVTNHITPVELSWKELGVTSRLENKDRNAKLLLCDSAGLFDTRGVEIEISNTIAMIQALQNAASVQIVFFLSKATFGARFENLEEQMTTLIDLIQSASNAVRGFFYVFTGFQESDLLAMKKQLESLVLRSRHDNKSVMYQEFLEDLKEKLDNVTSFEMAPDHAAVFCNPLIPQQRILIANSLYTMRNDCLKNPRNDFRPFISPKATADVKQHISNLRQAIELAVQNRDYQFANYRLGQYKKLARFLSSTPFVESEYKALCDRLSQLFSKGASDTSQSLKRRLQSEELLSESDLKDYQSFINNEAASDAIRREHLEAPGRGFMADFINEANVVADRLKEQLDTSNLLKRKSDLAKLQLMTQYFPEVTSAYKLAQDFLDKQVREHIQKVVKELKQTCSLEDFVEHTCFFINAIKELREFVPSSLQNAVNQAGFEAKSFVMKEFQQLPRALNDFFYNKDDVSLGRLLKLHSHATRIIASNRESLLSVSDLQKIVESFQSSIKSKLEELRQSVQSALDRQGDAGGRFRTAKGFFENAKRLADAEGVKEFCVSEYSVIFGFLQTRLSSLRVTISASLTVLRTGYDLSEQSVHRLEIAMEELEGASWTTLYFPIDYEVVLEEAKTTIGEHLLRLRKDLERCEFGLYSLDDMKTAADVFQHVETLKTIMEAKRFADHKDKLEALEAKYVESALEVFAESEQKFRPQKIDLISSRKQLETLQSDLTQVKGMHAPLQILVQAGYDSPSHLESTISSAEQRVAELLSEKEDALKRNTTWLRGQIPGLEKEIQQRRQQLSEMTQIMQKYQAAIANQALSSQQLSFLSERKYQGLNDLEQRISTQIALIADFEKKSGKFRFDEVIDIPLVNAYYKYIHVTFPLKALQQRRTALLANASNYFRSYLEYMTSEMDYSLSQLNPQDTIGPASSDERKILLQHGENIQRHLNDLETLSKNPNVHEQIRKIFGAQKAQLVSFADAFRKRLQKHAQQLSRRLTQAKMQRLRDLMGRILILVDALQECSTEHAQLATTFQADYIDLLQSTSLNVDQFLNSGRFDTIKAELDSFDQDSAHFKQQTLAALCTSVHTRCNELRLASNTSYTVRLPPEVSMLYNIIIGVQQHLGDRLSQSDQEQIRSCLAECTKNLRVSVQQGVAQVSGNIDSFKLATAEGELNKLERFLHSLPQGLTESSLTDLIHEQQNRLKVLCDDLKLQVSKIKVAEFGTSRVGPSRVLAGLSDNQTFQFSALREEVLQLYLNTFESELDAIPAQVDSRTFEATLQKFESSVLSLPRDSHDQLRARIQNRRRQYDQQASQFQEAVGLCLARRDAAKICELHQEYSGSPSHSKAVQVLESGVTDHINSFDREISQAISPPHVNLRSSFQMLIGYQKHLSRVMQFVPGLCNNALKPLRHAYLQSVQAVIELFKTPTTVPLKLVNQTVSRFDLFAVVTHLQAECDVSVYSTDRESCDSAVVKVHNCIIDFLRLQRDRIKAGTASLLMDSIKLSLENLSNVTDLLTKVAHYANDFPCLESAHPSIKQTLDTLKSDLQGDLSVVPGHVAFDAIESIVQRFKNEDFSEASIRKSGATREEFFQQINSSLFFVSRAQELSPFLDNTQASALGSLTSQLKSFLMNRLQSIAGEASNLIGQPLVSHQHFDTLNAHLRALFSFHKHVRVIGTIDVNPLIENVTKVITSRVREESREATNHLGNLETVAAQLDTLKTLSINLPHFRELIDHEIDSILDKFKSMNTVGNPHFQLAIIMEKKPGGRALTDEHSLFKGWMRGLFHDRTGRQNIDYVIKCLDEALRPRIKQLYIEFDQAYQDAVKSYFASAKKDQFLPLVHAIHELVDTNPACAMASETSEPLHIDGLRYQRVRLPPGAPRTHSSLIGAVAAASGQKPADFLLAIAKYVHANASLCASLLSPITIDQYLKDLERGIEHKGEINLLANVLQKSILTLDWNGVIIPSLSAIDASRRSSVVFICWEQVSDPQHGMTNVYDAFLYDTLLFMKTHSAPDIIADLRQSESQRKKKRREKWWNGSTFQLVPKLLGHLFAFWTLKNLSQETTTNDLKGPILSKFLLQPHPVQAVALLRMFGLGKAELTNHIIQVLTGEGKSVVLAMAACVFALFGANVSCACYSSHLSDRDYRAFQSFFVELGIAERIQYGTFERLCELFINKNGEVRKRVHDLVCKPNKSASASSVSSTSDAKVDHDDSKNPLPAQSSAPAVRSQQRINVLLIDEVDVFFGKDFYSSVYSPAALVRHASFTKLATAVWNAHKDTNPLSAEDGKAAIDGALQECKAAFVGWEALVDGSLSQMLADVKSITPPFYVYNKEKDQLGYKHQDSVVYNKSEGYKTLFAYFKEHELGRISAGSLANYIAMEIKAGYFSYSAMPLQFQFIFGVSGTLTSLYPEEWAIIKTQFQITEQTICPSAYGDSQFTWAKVQHMPANLQIVAESAFFAEVMREISSRLQSTVLADAPKRAVLVFFETRHILEGFENIHHNSLPNNTVMMNEELEAKDVDMYVRRATTSGQVTLLTRDFGRGTDFVCRDDLVLANGGVHVIQTFLSEELSEEKQIQGRTARQGQIGSYSMVLSYSNLQKFFPVAPDSKLDSEESMKAEISQTQASGKSVYELLNSKREAMFKQQYNSRTVEARQFQSEHEYALRFLGSLDAGDMDFVHRFLLEKSLGDKPAPTSCSNTVVLMDATGSMSLLLQKSKEKVVQMFTRARQILSEQKLPDDNFALQFTVYRNYNADADSILQSSGWETDPAKLRHFMDAVQAACGWGREAVEVGFFHVNEQIQAGKMITQVILIGDAPPNTEAEVIQKRSSSSFGANYWSKSRFGQVKSHTPELQKLVAKKIPVHAFYVAQFAKDEFTAISNLCQSAGLKSRCEFLDVNDANRGADDLANIVLEEVLRGVGGAARGEQLVKAARDRFRSSYRSAS